MGATSMYYVQVFIGITSAFISSNCAKAGYSDSETIPQKESLKKSSSSTSSKAGNPSELTAKPSKKYSKGSPVQRQVTSPAPVAPDTSPTPIAPDTSPPPIAPATLPAPVDPVISLNVAAPGLQTTEMKKPQVQNLPQKKPQPLLTMFKFESASFLNSVQKNASQGDETVNDAPSLVKINEDILSDEAASIKKKLSQQKSIKGLGNSMKTQASAEPITARSKENTVKSISIVSTENLKRDHTLDRKRPESLRTKQPTPDERIDPTNERTKPEPTKLKELTAEEQLHPLQVTMKSVSDVKLPHLRYYRKPIELHVET
ncbi:unnamed protein product [Angiostrongylus costaricensis]|uniref:Flocculation protein FLO11-like n=1 Tax=Angiostrongylus costaricensis TaxID=334426 RepID=A0A0R3PCD2_ANGCS|nr:unnamed protein product [Angiostrongylus costaricensis]